MLSTIDKASELLKDDSVTVLKIAEATGIDVKELTKARESADIEKTLKSMSYDEVISLADLFNDIQINYINSKKDNDFYKFVVRMGEWFTEAIDNQREYYHSEDGYPDDLMIAAAVQKLNDISTKEKSIMLDLYFSYTRDGQEMK